MQLGPRGFSSSCRDHPGDAQDNKACHHKDVDKVHQQDDAQPPKVFRRRAQAER